MGLASALSTALTGMSASETTIDVVGNNLANADTAGFKASDVNFATQFLQTQTIGSAPSGDNAGTNPIQTGLGALVASVTPNFSQGTIQSSTSSTDMAIQGDGFFTVQGTGGQNLYTRNGVFQLNSEQKLTTMTGNAVLGYAIDSATLRKSISPWGARPWPRQPPMSFCRAACPPRRRSLRSRKSCKLASWATVALSGHRRNPPWRSPRHPQPRIRLAWPPTPLPTRSLET
jgi:flagellar hook-basal body protein